MKYWYDSIEYTNIVQFINLRYYKFQRIKNKVCYANVCIISELFSRE